jgi:hypothetical protein
MLVILVNALISCNRVQGGNDTASDPQTTSSTPKAGEDGKDEDDSLSLLNLTNLIDATAKHKGFCDMDLYDKYVVPVYTAADIDISFEKKMALNDYIGQNPEKATLSCYGLVATGEEEVEEVFMKCEPKSCVSLLDSKHPFDCCKCIKQEPYVFEKNPDKPGICQIKESVLGDPCDYESSKERREEVNDEFQASLEKAKERWDYVAALVTYAVDSQTDQDSPTMRLTCQTFSHNLECKEDGTCGCVSKGPYMKYVPDSKEPYCVGEQGALCHVSLITKDAAFEEITECVTGLTCQEAVPGLYCEDLDDKNCVFKRSYTDGDQNLTDPVLLWDLRACGGKWEGKSLLPANVSVSRKRNSFQDFGACLLLALMAMAFE